LQKKKIGRLLQSLVLRLVGFRLNVFKTGLPDGLFSSQKSRLGDILEGLGMGNVLFYDHLEYFTVIWYNLWQFGIVCGHLVYFSILVCLDKEEIWQP
jgi:hypothetical protein